MNDFLSSIKLLLNIGSSDTSKDDLLALLIDNATQYAQSYMHREDTDCVGKSIVDMVIYDYNRIGTEGLNSESFGGVSFNYSSSYPENIMSQLRAHRKIRTVQAND